MLTNPLDRLYGNGETRPSVTPDIVAGRDPGLIMKESKMREFMGIAFNDIIVPDEDGALAPRAEAIVVYSEPKWEVTADGMLPRRVLNEYRVALSLNGVRKLVIALTERMERMETLESELKDVRVPRWRDPIRSPT